MARILLEHRERRSVGAIESPQRKSGVPGRSGDARRISLEPTRRAIGILPQTIVTDVGGSRTHPEARWLQSIGGLCNCLADLLERSLIPSRRRVAILVPDHW